MKFVKSLTLILTVFSAAFFVACGDDETGDSPKKEESSIESGYYESVDDLPVCTDSIAGSFAKVEEDYYACSDDGWKKISSFAKGVCNIQECDKSMDGKYAYVKSSRKTYQCVANEWLDSDSKGFTEKEYVACYVDAIIRDSVAAKDDLPKCTEDLENGIFKVSDDLYACSFKKWMELLDEVVSESDLPSCKKDSSSVFVLNKMKNYICSDGTWYVDGKALASKDTSSKDSALVITDSTKVRGICMPSASTVEKNEEVRWRFINMGGTVGTYTWLFNDDSVSTKASPKMSYATAGAKTAKLIINQGYESESDTIACSGLSVVATPVTSCSCSASKKGLLNVSEVAPDTVTWTIQNCEGGDELAYRWSGVSGGGATATVVAINSESYSPKVVVENADGATMNVSCPSIEFKGVFSGSCSLEESEGQWVFHAGSFKNYPSDYSLTLTLVGDNYEDESVSTRYYAGHQWVVKDAYVEPESSSSEEIVESSSSEEVVESSSSEEVVESSSSEEIEESSSSEEVIEPESSSSEEIEESSSSEEVVEPESSSSDEIKESSSSEEVVEPESSSSEEIVESSGSEEVVEPGSSSVIPSSSSVIPSSSSVIPSSSSVIPSAVEGSSSSEEIVLPLDKDELPIIRPAPIAIEKEDESSRVFSYALLYNADTVCSAATTTCGPSGKSSVPKGSSVNWVVNSINGFVPTTYYWTFSTGQVSLSSSPTISMNKPGIVKATLLLDKGLKTEKQITCSSVNVETALIEGCSCGAPTLVSASADLGVNNPVQYKWTVSGCRSEGAEPLSYTWSRYGKDNETFAVGNIITKGVYGPSVTVKNTEGRTLKVSCENVRVQNSDDPINEIEYENGLVLESGMYEIKNCGQYSSRNAVEVYINGSSTDCESWLNSSYRSYNNFVPYECNGYFSSAELPLVISVPKGETMTIRQCF